MHETEPAIDLSLIVPVLNEAEGIDAFLTGLARQQGVSFQVILCDGGSTDGTVQRVCNRIGALSFPLILLHEEKGRARQMNAGVREATGEYLLFLHADSILPDPNSLSKALCFLREAEQRTGDNRVAARFALRFQKGTSSKPSSYYYAEGKARLDRSGCIHGDQGFLLSRSFFEMVGSFDPSDLVMEDTRFAERVRGRGSWVLLPLELSTSARRFETEGLAVRHVLNMILMTLAAVGREDFVRAMPGIYAAQSMTGRLLLFPFLDRIRLLIKGLPYQVRKEFWFSVGRYVAINAWQIPFFLDMRRNYRKNVPVGQGVTPFLDFYDRHGETLFRTRPLAVVAAGLTFLSFHGVGLLARRRGW